MENTKSFRNPFSKIAKVFKYEMKHSVRILLPVYGAIIIIAFIAGLFLIRSFNNGNIDLNFTLTINGDEDPIDQVTGFLLLLYFIIVVSSAVVSVLILTKRFKNGLLGDEAYLNLSLPVTMGEHLCGRVLSIILWAVCYIITMVISLLAITISQWKPIFREITPEIIATLLAGVVTVITSALVLILFIYLINAIGHLSKKHRTLVKIAAIILVLSLTSRIFGAENLQYFIETNNDVKALYFVSLYNCILSVLYGVATYFILKLKLNLE